MLKILILLFFIFSCTQKRKVQLQQNTPIINIDCIDINRCIDTIGKNRIQKLCLSDKNYYKIISHSEPHGLYQLFEDKLADGYWVFFKDTNCQWPIILMNVKNHKRNGLFIYADSVIKYYQNKNYLNGVKHGMNSYYANKCQIESLFEYNNGFVVDTMYSYLSNRQINFIRVFDNIGNIKEHIDYWEWPSIKHFHKRFYYDSTILLIDSIYSKAGKIVSVKNQFYFGKKKIETMSIYNSKTEVIKVDTLFL